MYRLNFVLKFFDGIVFMCLVIDVWVVRSLELMDLKGSRTERNLLAAFAG